MDREKKTKFKSITPANLINWKFNLSSNRNLIKKIKKFYYKVF